MYNSTIINQNNAIFTQEEATPVIQTLNVISQKVIQVNKPTGYYEDKEKIKMFIYQVYLYWMVNTTGFPDRRLKVVFTVSYCRGKALE